MGFAPSLELLVAGLVGIYLLVYAAAAGIARAWYFLRASGGRPLAAVVVFFVPPACSAASEREDGRQSARANAMHKEGFIIKSKKQKASSTIKRDRPDLQIA